MILRTTLIWRYYQLYWRQISSAKLSVSRTLLTVGFCSIFLGACAEWLPTPHRLDLQQGNTIKLEQLESIEIGMTKSEVRKIMGTPMLADPFHNQRWDYIYRFIPNKGFERKSLLTLHFKDDKLIKIDDTEYVEP